MTAIIYILTTIVSIAGVALVAWTFIDTRKKYYNEFVKRKSEREKLHLP